MPPKPPVDPIVVLGTFLHRSRVKRVFFAEGAVTTPPTLAYLVHFPRLTIVLWGRDSIWIEQERKARLVHLGVGEAIVIPANCWSQSTRPGSVITLNILFGPKQVGLSLVDHYGRCGKTSVRKSTLSAAWNDTMRHLMQALLGLHTDPTNAAVPVVEALLRACLGALTTPVVAPKRRAATLYDSVCMFVQETFRTPLTRESVAAHFRVTPNHLSRLFKREGAIAFNEYVTYLRISRAKYLLENYLQSVDEVAAACGFSESSYFCRVFRRVTGMRPTSYRQQQAGGRVVAKLP